MHARIVSVSIVLVVEIVMTEDSEGEKEIVLR